MEEKGSRKRSELILHYLSAKNWVSSSEYSEEIVWQSTRSSSSFTESDFLREFAWVVLNSGFRERIVRRHFNYISLCFFDWESSHLISQNSSLCIETAMSAIGNVRKLTAITQVALEIDRIGFSEFAELVVCNPIEKLQNMPFLGNITAHHLAKNLGFNVAKADRHLMRIAARFGYNCVNDMCLEIAKTVGDDISVADLILWRFEEQFGKFSSVSRSDKY